MHAIYGINYTHKLEITQIVATFVQLIPNHTPGDAVIYSYTLTRIENVRTFLGRAKLLMDSCNVIIKIY